MLYNNKSSLPFYVLEIIDLFSTAMLSKELEPLYRFVGTRISRKTDQNLHYR